MSCIITVSHDYPCVFEAVYTGKGCGELLFDTFPIFEESFKVTKISCL